MDRKYAAALSIGSMCQTAWHLHIHLEKTIGSKGPAYFFDWFWRDKGLAGVAEAIRRDFALSAQDFELRRVEDHWEGYCVPYGCYFTHDFHFKGLDELQSHQAMAEQMDRVLSKYRHVSATTRSALLKPVLLVACGPLDSMEVDLLVSALHEFGCRDFDILQAPFRNLGQVGVTHPRVIVRPITFTEWPGDASSWADALADVQLVRT